MSSQQFFLDYTINVAIAHQTNGLIKILSVYFLDKHITTYPQVSHKDAVFMKVH